VDDGFLIVLKAIVLEVKVCDVAFVLVAHSIFAAGIQSLAPVLSTEKLVAPCQLDWLSNTAFKKPLPAPDMPAGAEQVPPGYVPTALVQAINFKPWTCVVEATVKVNVYVTPVALGTPEEIARDREANWPMASACGNTKGDIHETKRIRVASKATTPGIGLKTSLNVLNTFVFSLFNSFTCSLYS
jgi:hypothetical protein